MKLIDLDKALAEAEDECRMSDDWKVSHEMMNVFKYQPTVKAIPIEWIKEWYKKALSKSGFMGDEMVSVEDLLEDWEKENEHKESD